MHIAKKSDKLVHYQVCILSPHFKVNIHTLFTSKFDCSIQKITKWCDHCKVKQFIAELIHFELVNKQLITTLSKGYIFLKRGLSSNRFSQNFIVQFRIRQKGMHIAKKSDKSVHRKCIIISHLLKRETGRHRDRVVGKALHVLRIWICTFKKNKRCDISTWIHI